MLATVTRPTTGRITWDGQEVMAHPDPFRRRLGYLPQDFGIYPNLTAREFLQYLAAARGLSGRNARRRVTELLGLVNLSEARDRKLGSMSGGMKQRVGIAQALLNDPQLLLVDEPTAGLDPEERIRFRNLLDELAGDRVVLLSSHIVSDIEAVASQVAIVSGGRLLRFANPADLLRQVDDLVWDLTVDNATFEQLEKDLLVSSVSRTNGMVTARIIGPPPPGLQVTAAVPALEDAYLYSLRKAGVTPQ
jgi:ABC-type multidrug transport system ATPase subunit